MTKTPQSMTEQVRELANAILRDLGSVPSAGELRETMLIRGGNYCGHRYRLGDYEAVWFIEEDELKVLGSNGVIRKLTASAAVAAGRTDSFPTRRAA